MLLLRHACLQSADICGELLGGFAAILIDDIHDATAGDDTVSQLGHPSGLLRSVDAEADGQRGIPRFTRDADDLTKVSLDMAAHAGDAHGGNDIYKAGRVPQALTDTLFRGRSDHLDDIDAIRIR